MAESTGLLNLHTGNRITSSNLVLSAKRPCRNLCEAFLHQCRSENSHPQNVWLYIVQPSGVIIFIINRFQPVRRSNAAGCAPSTSRGHPAAPGRILFYEYSCSVFGKKGRLRNRFGKAAKGHRACVNIFSVNYFSGSGRMSRLSSSSWVWSILDGASIITSRPWLFFGKAIKSRMDSLPAKRAQTRSKPKARPP